MIGAATLQPAGNDRLIILGLCAACVVAAAVATMLLRRFWPGRKRPVALGIATVGVALALPGYLSIARVIDERAIPEWITVPCFILGLCLIVTGALIFRALLCKGEPRWFTANPCGRGVWPGGEKTDFFSFRGNKRDASDARNS